MRRALACLLMALFGVPAAASAAAPTLTAAGSAYGSILFDGRGFVLYAFTRDAAGRSTCAGDCATAWPPYVVRGRPTAGPGVNGTLLGTARRRDGSRQVTYAGRPLYYWSGDTAHTILCQHVNLHGGFWYVVNPNGTPNKAKGIGTMSMM